MQCLVTRLTVYIDEAGDPGVRDGLRYLGNRHEWLCTSAVVIRTEREPKVVDWVKDLREVARSRQAGVLHYQRITRERREGVCAKLATLPVRAFTMASHKSNLREYVNPRIQKQMDDGTFYNWCMRLMMERLTAWAWAWMSEHGGVEPLRIVFAERGGHSYDKMFGYFRVLRMQKDAGTLFLPGLGLKEPTLDQAEWSVAPTTAAAGLQLADVVASAFYQGANVASPSFDPRPAQALRPIMVAGAKGKEANMGVTVWPLPHQSPLDEAAKPIFRHYGYEF